MDIIHNILLGLLQGLTEFLPVSSSGHLYLAQVWLDIEPSLSLEIFFHAASLAAVLVYFRKKIWKIVQKTFSIVMGKLLLGPPLKKGENVSDGVLGLKLLAATILTVPTALLVESKLDTILSLDLVATTLIVTGGLILISEKLRPQKERTFTWPIALFLGLVQGMAVLPGISRSGLTIAFLILLGLNRKKSAEISFLLSIPTILGALVFALKDDTVSVGLEEGIGFLVCIGSSILAIIWMMKLIQKRWIWFAPYCVLLGLGLYIWG